MRRSLYLLAFFLLGACSDDDDDDDDVLTRSTRVSISPKDFLGDQPCSKGGGMELYQARLLDVTEGLENAFVLPSSYVVPCTAEVSFDYVQQGHLYIAEIVGFDRSDVKVQNPGSPVVVDMDGKSVMPRFTTTCWGTEDTEPPSMGGASGEDAVGGEGGASSFLGVRVYDKTTVYVQGCEPLKDSGMSGETAASFELADSLESLSCGTGSGQVDRFVVVPEGMSPDGGDGDGAEGGAGGAAQVPAEPTTAACTDAFVLTDLAPNKSLPFTAYAYEFGKTEPSFRADCGAFTLPGVTVDGICLALRAIAP